MPLVAREIIEEPDRLYVFFPLHKGVLDLKGA
jgi:hypothetical protein